MRNEITRKSVLTKALEMDFTEAEKVVIEKMIASLDKKGSSGVSEKVQAERAAEVTAILEVLAEGNATATEIAKATGMSVQKVSARLKAMVADGKAFRKDAKGKNPAQFGAQPFEVADEGEAE